MKTGGTQGRGSDRSNPIKRPTNNTRFKDGDTIKCIKSASCAYVEGNTYQVYQNDKGWMCITGEDGLEDILSMMVSEFKKES